MPAIVFHATALEARVLLVRRHGLPENAGKTASERERESAREQGKNANLSGLICKTVLSMALGDMYEWPRAHVYLCMCIVAWGAEHIGPRPAMRRLDQNNTGQEIALPRSCSPPERTFALATIGRSVPAGLPAELPAGVCCSSHRLCRARALPPNAPLPGHAYRIVSSAPAGLESCGSPAGVASADGKQPVAARGACFCIGQAASGKRPAASGQRQAASGQLLNAH